MAEETKPQGSFDRDAIVRSNSIKTIGNGAETKTILKYPEQVGTSEVPNYVMFYPLVRGNSIVNQPTRSRALTDTGENRAESQNATETQAVASGLAYGGLRFALSKSTDTRLFSKSSSKNKLGNPLSKQQKQVVNRRAAWSGVKGLVQGAAMGVGSSLIQGTDTLYSSTTAIALQVQSNPAFKYSASWSSADLGSFVGAFASGNSGLANMLANPLDTAGIALRNASKMSKATKGTTNPLSALPSNDLVQAFSKKVENPYKEQLFRSMGFRQFQFTYRFAPESEAEFEDVKNIIQTFAIHMHPEQDDSGYFFIYPSEFVIAYYYKEKENENIRKIAQSALINMDVSYGGQEGFTTFLSNVGGKPTEITLTLTFQELELLTNKRAKQGF